MQKKFFQNKRVCVSGACGTIGSRLVRLLLEEYGVGELVGLDNNESALFFQMQRYSGHPGAHFYLADVRDDKKIPRMLQNIDVLFHTAAYKHVLMCEWAPFEAVQTNILGVRNIIQAANAARVERVVFTSSDKAVNPTNVMGASKLMGERLMTAANSTLREPTPVFSSTRFGNVLGSRGSVLPIFRAQIQKGGPVTLTSEEMTRFIMSVDQAVRLVIDSSVLARGGEVFVTKMPVIRIKDLAEVMIQELAPGFGRDPDKIEIQIIGTNPGEKMYEELMSEEETRRTWELEEYFVVRPAFDFKYRKLPDEYPGLVAKSVDRAYHSGNEKVLTKDELADFLKKNNLLLGDGEEPSHPDERFWPQTP